MKTYSDTAEFVDFRDFSSRGIIFTGFSDDKSIRVYFSNYPDASLAARKLSACGIEAGSVFQTVHNDSDDLICPGEQTADDIKIQRGESPRSTPMGQFSLFYVPLGMESKAAQFHFAEMHKIGKVNPYDIPSNKAREMLLNFKHGLNSHALR